MWKRLEVYAATTSGTKDGPNQDGILVGENMLLDGELTAVEPVPTCLALADGISGDPGGFLARTIALVEVQSAPYPATTSEAAEIFVRASDSITAYGRRKHDYLSMSTGLSAAWIEPQRILICASGNVGVFLVTDNEVSKMTVDQEDALGALTGYLGAGNRTIRSTVAPLLLEHGLEKARHLVLATDGLTFYLEDEELPRILTSGHTGQEMGKALISAALERGSPDNMSVAIATFVS